MLNHRKISSLTFLASHPQQHGSWLHHPQILPVGAISEGSTREIRYYQRQVTAVSVLAPPVQRPGFVLHWFPAKLFNGCSRKLDLIPEHCQKNVKLFKEPRHSGCFWLHTPLVFLSLSPLALVRGLSTHVYGHKTKLRIEWHPPLETSLEFGHGQAFFGPNPCTDIFWWNHKHLLWLSCGLYNGM
jgi:hypothetical protein